MQTYNTPTERNTLILLLIMIFIGAVLLMNDSKEESKECSDLKVERVKNGYNVIDCNGKKHFYKEAEVIQYTIIEGESMQIRYDDNIVETYKWVNDDWVKDNK